MLPTLRHQQCLEHLSSAWHPQEPFVVVQEPAQLQLKVGSMFNWGPERMFVIMQTARIANDASVYVPGGREYVYNKYEQLPTYTVVSIDSGVQRYSK